MSANSPTIQTNNIEFIRFMAFFRIWYDSIPGTMKAPGAGDLISMLVEYLYTQLGKSLLTWVNTQNPTGKLHELFKERQ